METNEMYAKVGMASRYKLLPLTVEVLETMKNGEKLRIKAAGRELAVTCDSKTFQLRQKNHSNTQLLMSRDHAGRGLVAMAGFSSELELKLSVGSIDLSEIPFYDGDLLKLMSQSHMSVEELLQKSVISESEFYTKWIELNGSEVDRKAVILSQNYVTEVLGVVINTVIACKMDPAQPIAIGEIYKLIDNDDNTITIEVIHTILVKFSQNARYTDIEFTLDLIKISTWYGVHSLKLFAQSLNISIDEFLIKWRSTLPSALSTSLDISYLKGHYYSPYPDQIRYINKNTLPSDPQSRFKNLFLLQQNWLIDDIIPFITDLNTKNFKPSAFIMKYARVKKQGSTTCVSAR